jgi:hypothetical protein
MLRGFSEKKIKTGHHIREDEEQEMSIAMQVLQTLL